MANGSTHEPYPPRWAMIYMLAFMLALLAWIIICVVHGGPPWEHHT
jgi:hypothetical protein